MTRSARVTFVNRYFYPDLSATSQILSDLAIHLATSGWDVTVVTSRQRYTDPNASLPRREALSGVKIVRIPATAFGRGSLLGRAIDYLTFHLFATAHLLVGLRRGDIVVAKTDPPLISVAIRLAVRFRAARQINWLQDLFPEVAVVLEPQWVSGWVARLAKRARDWSLTHADANVVLGDLMLDRVIALGVPPEKVVAIPNWTDDQAIMPTPREQNPLRTKWGLTDKFVVVYSGNLGRAHEFGTILGAARLLQHRTDIIFLIIGEGAQLHDVRRSIVKDELTNVVERPYQPRACLAQSLGVADLHLISLLPALEGLIVPSKFYGIAAAQRPTAFIGDLDGEIARALRKHDCGRSFAVGAPCELAQFIVYLLEQPSERERLGRNARQALEAEWSQAKAFKRWQTVLRQYQRPSSAATEHGRSTDKG